MTLKMDELTLDGRSTKIPSNVTLTPPEMKFSVSVNYLDVMAIENIGTITWKVTHRDPKKWEPCFSIMLSILSFD